MIRALCDPRNLAMISVAYTRVDRGQERKCRVRIETKVKEKQLDLGSDRKVSNPNPRGKGTPDLLGLCVTHGRTCAGRMSAALAKGAHHSKQPLAVRDAGGTSARARGLRAPPPGRSTAARSRTGGARAPARGPTAAPATLLPSRHGRSGRRCVAWREKGEGRMT